MSDNWNNFIHGVDAGWHQADKEGVFIEYLQMKGSQTPSTLKISG